MASRSIVATSLGLSLLFASGCPEPDDEGGSFGETSETGETGGDTVGTGVEEGGDVDAPVETGDEDGDGDGDPAGGETGTETTGDGDGDDGGQGDEPSFDDPGRCWDAMSTGDDLPRTLFDNTIDRNDDIEASCGGSEAPDYQLGFRAPWTGTFVFDTDGSSFDAVLSVTAGMCSPKELACNDDFVDLDARVVIDLVEDQEVTINVDGANPFEQGPVKLNIREFIAPSCEPIFVAPPYPKQLDDDTSSGTNELSSACGGFDSPERVYEFLAQGPGTYRFSTAGSSFDTVLYLIDPDEGCGGQPIACNDDADFELHSELTVDLAGGERILVVVDGNDDEQFGEYQLLAEKL